MNECGQSPRAEESSLPWPGKYPVCGKPAGHADGKPSERHEGSGYWWSERQQAPVREGHIHSAGYFCSPACPAYAEGRMS